jgi:glutathione S-transferase
MLQYIFPSGPEGKPNQTTIDAAKPDIRHTLEVLDKQLGGSKWFAGDSVTLADLFVGPLLLSLSHFPGGEQLSDGLANLARLKQQLVGEPKFMSAAPQS